MIERERKFVVSDHEFLASHAYALIVQGYLFVGGECAVRVRRERSGGVELPPFVAVKGPCLGEAREKFEMEISKELAGMLMLQSLGKVVKLRYQFVDPRGHIWTVDAFQFAHEGLYVAELEVEFGADVRELPDWCGVEVTDDQRFLNQSLALDSTRFYD